MTADSPWDDDRRFYGEDDFGDTYFEDEHYDPNDPAESFVDSSTKPRDAPNVIAPPTPIETAARHVSATRNSNRRIPIDLSTTTSP